MCGIHIRRLAEVILWFCIGLTASRVRYPLVNVFQFAKWTITLLFMGKSAMSMAIFNRYVNLPEGNLEGHRQVDLA